MAVAMVIQKTTNVEPVGPAQHLLFETFKVSYRKGCPLSLHNTIPDDLEIVIFIVIEIIVIEEVEFLEVFIYLEIVIFLAFLGTAAAAGFLPF